MMLLRHGRATTMSWQMSHTTLLALWILARVPLSRAQDATPPSSSITSAPLTTGAIGTFTGSVRHTRSHMTRSNTFATQLLAHNATSSTESPPTYTPPTELFPAADDPDDEPMPDENVFNYYFLFLLIFGVLVAAFLWWVRRRRVKRKEQMRLSGQTALARDLEGWSAPRRFLNGRYGRHQAPARVRREEGLDEHGEAPPPYQQKSEYTVGQAPAEERSLSIPLRTLPRDPAARNLPPEYDLPVEHTQATSPSPSQTTR